MDIISLNEAATANSRIEKFIENPDSTSGVVTVPKVIASGETITIPSGRVAILPNVQIDGVLNIENDGEVFIPSGATLGDLDAQLALKAPLVNPAFTNPTATTQAAQDNSTKVATTAYVDGKMVLRTAVASTSGTSIDFTGISSWVKKITVMFSGVSTNGSSLVQIQLGDSGGVENTGYSGAVGQSGAAVLNYTTAFATGVDGASSFVRYGAYSIALLTGNTWVINGTIGYSDSARFMTAGGSKSLSGTLDRIRITTANGTDTFDAGQINILYEG